MTLRRLHSFGEVLEFVPGFIDEVPQVLRFLVFLVKVQEVLKKL